MTTTRNINYSDHQPRQVRRKADGAYNRQYFSSPRGEKHYNHKLTADDVRLIRQIHEDGQALLRRYRECYSNSALAEKFEVTVGAIEKVVSYKSWRQVK